MNSLKIKMLIVILLFMSTSLSAQLKISILKKKFSFNENNKIIIENISQEKIFYVISGELYDKKYWLEFDDDISTPYEGSTTWNQLKPNKTDSIQINIGDLLSLENIRKKRK